MKRSLSLLSSLLLFAPAAFAYDYSGYSMPSMTPVATSGSSSSSSYSYPMTSMPATTSGDSGSSTSTGGDPIDSMSDAMSEQQAWMDAEMELTGVVIPDMPADPDLSEVPEDPDNGQVPMTYSMTMGANGMPVMVAMVDSKAKQLADLRRKLKAKIATKMKLDMQKNMLEVQLDAARASKKKLNNAYDKFVKIGTPAALQRALAIKNQLAQLQTVIDKIKENLETLKGKIEEVQAAIDDLNAQIEALQNPK